MSQALESALRRYKAGLSAMSSRVSQGQPGVMNSGYPDPVHVHGT